VCAQRKVVLITGASTGIGLAVVKELQKHNLFIIATARKSSLERFRFEGIKESDHLKILPLDVTSDKERKHTIRMISRKWGGVDILINNAGVCYRAVVEHTGLKDEFRQFDINYFAPVRLARLLIPEMRKKRSGKIINISSAAGMMAMPTMGNYSASKFALEGISESLWYELKPWGIHVCLVQPGFINSNACFNVRYTDQSFSSFEKESDPYHFYYTNMSSFVLKMMRLSPVKPEKVAEKIFKIMNQKNPPLRIPVTPDAVLFSWMRRIIPRRIYHYLLYRSLPGIRGWLKKR